MMPGVMTIPLQARQVAAPTGPIRCTTSSLMPLIDSALPAGTMHQLPGGSNESRSEVYLFVRNVYLICEN